MGGSLYALGDNDSAEHAIDMVDMGGGIVKPQQDLREALREKALKYGALDKPYLLVVADGKNRMFGKNSVKTALTQTVFGDAIEEDRAGTARITAPLPHPRPGACYRMPSASSSHRRDPNLANVILQ